MEEAQRKAPNDASEAEDTINNNNNNDYGTVQDSLYSVICSRVPLIQG